LIIKPGYVFQISGFRPLKPLDIEKLDKHAGGGDILPTSFFSERNTLEVEVPRDMSLRQFLDEYDLDLPHMRRQIAQQKGHSGRLPDSHRLTKGERFTIELTPSTGK
jgi:hypothetical protein